MTNETYCGLEEHTHTDECYADVLICGQEENESHTHTAGCYETQLVCRLEEHTHTAACEIANITEAETIAPSTEESSENTDSEAVSSEISMEASAVEEETEAELAIEDITLSNSEITVASDDSAVIAELTSADVNSVSDMFLWIYDNSGTKALGYSTYSGNGDILDPIDDALSYTDSEATWYLIPLHYFTESLSSYGYRFDASECPFNYAPNAGNTNTKEAAYYVSVDGEYYVRVQDTYNGDNPRTNIYYTKDYTRVYDTVEGVTPSSATINLFDYWTTSQDAVDVETNSDTGINKDHALKFAYNPDQWDVTKNTAYNYWTKSSAVYPDIVQNTLGDDGYPALNSDVTGDNESLAYLFNPNVSHDGKESFTKVKNLLQIDSSGYYYYDCADNYAVYDEDENSFILYDDWAIYSDSIKGQFFPFNSLESLNSKEPQEKSSNDSEMNHYFGMTLTTRFTQQYGGFTSSKKQVATTFEFSGDDDMWIFIDGVLVADLGGIHSAASVSIDFSTGKVYINGEETNTIGSAFQDAGVYCDYAWNATTPDKFDNNTYHTLKFYYLERGNSASDLKLKYNLTVIPETGILQGKPVQKPN